MIGWRGAKRGVLEKKASRSSRWVISLVSYRDGMDGAEGILALRLGLRSPRVSVCEVVRAQ